MYLLSIHDAVYNELEEISVYYGLKTEKLGQDFLNEFYNSIKVLKSSPFIYQIHFGNVRRINLTRFPYVVYYQVNDENVTVLAVFHGKQNPDNVLDSIVTRQN